MSEMITKEQMVEFSGYVIRDQRDKAQEWLAVNVTDEKSSYMMLGYLPFLTGKLAKITGKSVHLLPDEDKRVHEAGQKWPLEKTMASILVHDMAEKGMSEDVALLASGVLAMGPGVTGEVILYLIDFLHAEAKDLIKNHSAVLHAELIVAQAERDIRGN